MKMYWILILSIVREWKVFNNFSFIGNFLQAKCYHLFEYKKCKKVILASVFKLYSVIMYTLNLQFLHIFNITFKHFKKSICFSSTLQLWQEVYYIYTKISVWLISHSS